jgi:N-acetylglucosaminyldiphosphoundecaprenol N-acetyl-beta-D-mannosaminyltransferase
MTDLFGINFFDEGKQELATRVEGFLSAKGKAQIVKANTEFLQRAMSEGTFREVIQSASLVFADGKGVLWAAKYLSLPLTRIPVLRQLQAVWQMVFSGASLVFSPGYCQSPITENIPGVEALFLMLGVAEKNKAEVFFFGASQDDLEKAIEAIKKKFPKLKISGSLNGYDFQENKEINPVSVINNTKAKLLIVALGSPLQEYWISENLKDLKNIRVAVGEGGTMAFLSGTFKRAPKWVQKISLEWLWRLFANRSLTPNSGNRAKRIWQGVPVFIVRTIAYKLRRVN